MLIKYVRSIAAELISICLIHHELHKQCSGIIVQHLMKILPVAGHVDPVAQQLHSLPQGLVFPRKLLIFIFYEQAQTLLNKF